ncbi:hypothetical protein J2T09_001107 [Neorhizobium huautlense]|uniref:Uncharacterized protein n=1 Tax=Neorhizobium huautlense TaxID=67774 RepID=A0ABT9PPG4_9HYPH|nr:hypothetical protein [Neorhizobium huautlense]MDP9836363.1 hypothetical protein [Neorhizobium huautlense]
MDILEHKILACLNAADPDEGYERPAPIVGLAAAVPKRLLNRA